MVLSTMIQESQCEQQHTRSLGECNAHDAPVGVLKENPNLSIDVWTERVETGT